MSAPEESAEESAQRPIIAEHELHRLIGVGSSGEVWLARNAIGVYRAVKIIFRKSFPWPKPYEDEFQGLVRFEPLSRQHDGLVDILQIGGNPAAGYFYYVMELADDVETGQNIYPDFYEPRTLATDLATRRQLPIGECIRLGTPIASALGFMHRNGLIHRDVKPANIIFINGFPKLVDVGLVAEMFKTRSRVGTEGYIAPEGPGTPRADIYSLGKVLYEISTGKDRHAYPELPDRMENPAVARDMVRFNKIILRACRSDPRLRYRDAEELMSSLLSFQFSPRGPFAGRELPYLSLWINIGGLIVMLGVILFLVLRIWRLLH